ncbi:SDR family NAD(P)-dependent oxidoreductase [Pseudoalteromonas mariniglutinosa]|uniref:SDR family NAD(P)-dependent oxidoreductase n=1 Tax=Pseudoalteromonas mariniglutinosa TaxID=206042 RepID=UPI00384DD811
MENSIILFGANSAIAKAYIAHLEKVDSTANVITVSRTNVALTSSTLTLQHFTSDYSTSSLANITETLVNQQTTAKQIIIFNGVLHANQQMPEKKLEELDPIYFETLLRSNSLTPLLCVKAMLPILNHHQACVITALSARVGSIEDNQLGGWYSYRASKAALNMLFKTTAIELARRAKLTRLVLFHPGTTDTELSKPFQKNVPKDKLFSPEFVAKQLYNLLLHPENLTEIGQVAYLDWQGKPITW